MRIYYFLCPALVLWLGLFIPSFVYAVDEYLDQFNVPSNAKLINLSDDDFERLTQASTGATTGDWFVKFYREHCIKCEAVPWNNLIHSLSGRINVAQVDIDNNPMLARRFKVERVPKLIYFSKGKMFVVNGLAHELQELVHFATTIRRDSVGPNGDKGEPIPEPDSWIQIDSQFIFVVIIIGTVFVLLARLVQRQILCSTSPIKTKM